MRLLYGVQATGNGHITRARALAPLLSARGIEVRYLLSGRRRAALFDMEPFGEFAWCRGLTFATRAGRVAKLATLAGLRPLRLIRDIRDLDLAGIDRVVTDFEPVTAWAARRQGVPSVGIAHQYAFRYPVPAGRTGWLSRTLIRGFAPADCTVGVHWHHFGSPIVPPIIGPARHPPTLIPDKVLVYLPFESLAAVVAWARQRPHINFHLYAELVEPCRKGNVHLNPFSREAFPRDLASCAGVVSNAGFGLVSEAIQYGKKVLVKPLYGQMEQEANAAAVEQLGIGETMTGLDLAAFDRWWSMPQPQPRQFPDVAAALADWLAGDCAEPVQVLIDRLWQVFGQPLGRPGAGPVTGAGAAS